MSHLGDGGSVSGLSAAFHGKRQPCGEDPAEDDLVVEAMTWAKPWKNTRDALGPEGSLV